MPDGLVTSALQRARDALAVIREDREIATQGVQDHLNSLTQTQLLEDESGE